MDIHVRRRLLFYKVPLATIMCLGVLLANPLTAFAGSSGGDVSGDVVGYIVPWDQTNGYNAVYNNTNIYSDASFFWYNLDSTTPGNIDVLQSGSINSTEVSNLQAKNVGVEVVISNLISGSWNQSAAEAVINNSTNRSNFVTNATNLAVNNGYDGIELDFENLQSSDRTGLTTTVQDLATALHAQSKYLFVSVLPKSTDNPSGYPTQQAEDYSAIGDAADQVRVQDYGYCWESGCVGGSAPGTIDPQWWVDQNTNYAVNTMGASKVSMIFPAYGIDWTSGSSGVDLTYTSDSTTGSDGPTNADAVDLANYYSASPTWTTFDGSGNFVGSESFTYGTNHSVYYSNAYTIKARVDLANRYGVDGIGFWRLGGEDTTMYGAATSPESLLNSYEASDTTNPGIAFNGPLNGSTLSGTVHVYIKGTGTGGVIDPDGTVVKTLYYVDGTLAHTQYTQGLDNGLDWPAWNTTTLTNGTHTLKVVAYDQAGNTGNQQISVTISN